MAEYVLNQGMIIAQATPAGSGALGIVRISGKGCIEKVDKYFLGQSIADKKGYTITYGNIIDEDSNIIDDVLVSIFRAPKSFTGEDMVEISCHGSQFIIEDIIKLFVRNGVKPAAAGEFTLRAFLNGKMDLSQAEAVADVIASQNEASRRIAINHLKGGISDELQNLRSELIDFAAMIELELDFSEEDVEFANREQLFSLIDKIIDNINPLIQSFNYGNAIKSGIKIVIVGRPNAGKSTLLNSLLREERALVSEIPGTTRDTVEESMVIDGIKFRFVDTAGIRDAGDTIEKMGIERTYQQIGNSSLVLYIFDANNTSIDDVIAEVDKLVPEGMPAIIAANKWDLNPDIAKEDWQKLEDKFNTIKISAKQNENIEELKENILDISLEAKIEDNQTIITNVRHYEALKEAKAALLQVKEGLEMGVSGDLLAIDIRRSLDFIGVITGDISVDKDILGSIFSRFCIGK